MHWNSRLFLIQHAWGQAFATWCFGLVVQSSREGSEATSKCSLCRLEQLTYIYIYMLFVASGTFKVIWLRIMHINSKMWGTGPGQPPRTQASQKETAEAETTNKIVKNPKENLKAFPHGKAHRKPSGTNTNLKVIVSITHGQSLIQIWSCPPKDT